MIDEPIDDYLWNRSGDHDPELYELELLLSRYRHEPARRLAVDEPADGDESDH